MTYLVIKAVAVAFAILAVALFTKSLHKSTEYIAFNRMAEAKSCYTWSGIALSAALLCTAIAVG